MPLCWPGWPAFHGVGQDGGGSIVYQCQGKAGGTRSITNILNVTTFPNTPLPSELSLTDIIFINFFIFYFTLQMIVSDYCGHYRAEQAQSSPPRRVFMIIPSLRPFDDGRGDQGTRGWGPSLMISIQFSFVKHSLGLIALGFWRKNCTFYTVL